MTATNTISPNNLPTASSNTYDRTNNFYLKKLIDQA
jgi:hypothetical protein